MNSKEALRNIVRLSGMGGFLKNEEEIIKQDLDRLEKLEKENQCIKDDNTRLWHGLEYANKEISKLKQAISILKDKKVVVSHLLETKNVEEYNFPFKNFSTSFLTQEEYELLKNTLGEE